MEDMTRTALYAMIEDLQCCNAELDLTVNALREVAKTDPMTGLSRRGFGQDALDQLWKLSTRKRGQPYAVLFIDIDYFKSFNDTFGHAVGDTVLNLVAAVVLDQIRSTDMGVRWGGEELLVICPNTTQVEVLGLAARIRGCITCIDTRVGRRVTASVGVSDSAPGDETALQIVKRADDALYAAKGAGRNRVAQLFAETTA